MTDGQEREAFEAWAKGSFELRRRGSGRYSSNVTQVAWETWQARASLQGSDKPCPASWASGYTAGYERAKKDMAGLLEDKARLDWLADRDNQTGQILLPTKAVRDNPHDMRAAIDAARGIKDD